MRTTLTLEQDIAAALERLRRERQTSFKQLVNDVLRRGLAELSTPPAARPEFRTREVALGGCLVSNVDTIAEALAIAEGESFR